MGSLRRERPNPRRRRGEREREFVKGGRPPSRPCYRWVSLVPSFRKPAEVSVQKGGNETRGTSEDSLAREREDRRPRASLRYRSEVGSKSEQGGKRRPRSRREKKERGRRSPQRGEAVRRWSGCISSSVAVWRL